VKVDFGRTHRTRSAKASIPERRKFAACPGLPESAK
jgi:hypothetical protein